MSPEIPSLPHLVAFRQQVYEQFSRRADTLFEMLNALLTLPSATAPAHMMMLPGFQRRWGGRRWEREQGVEHLKEGISAPGKLLVGALTKCQ